jgi:hypothetical protein
MSTTYRVESSSNGTDWQLAAIPDTGPRSVCGSAPADGLPLSAALDCADVLGRTGFDRVVDESSGLAVQS